MDIYNLLDEYNSQQDLSKIIESLRSDIDENKDLLEELEIENVERLDLRHTETSLVFYKLNNQDLSIKYTFKVFKDQSVIPVGTYEYFMSLKREFVDEFFILK
ncbi:MAG: hypothetical protein KI790_05780 [Cyclobacteriaceae bacterium]|nr:hypothetical protein [Cyclobacteriaceae bacterium HetDA_MAG_MS6]